MATEDVSIVSFPFPRHNGEFVTQQYKAVHHALHIKNWLIEQGLVMHQDFEWKVNTINKTIEFTFLTNTLYATLVALQFTTS